MHWNVWLDVWNKICTTRTCCPDQSLKSFSWRLQETTQLEITKSSWKTSATTSVCYQHAKGVAKLWNTDISFLPVFASIAIYPFIMLVQNLTTQCLAVTGCRHTVIKLYSHVGSIVASILSKTENTPVLAIISRHCTIVAPRSYLLFRPLQKNCNVTYLFISS